MLNQNAFDAFVTLAKQSNLSVLKTDNDLFVYPFIPESKAHGVSNNFNLHVDEEILYIRDTSFWDECNQGSVVTDWGITIVPDNDKPDDILQFGWESIDHVEYKNKQLILFSSDNRNDNVPIHISFFLKNTDDDSLCKRNGEVLAGIFTEMAKSSVNPFEEVVEQINQLVQEDRFSEAIPIIKRSLNTFPEHKPYLSWRLGGCYILQKDFTNAISACNTGMEGLDKTDLAYAELSYLKYASYQELGNYIEARKYALTAAIYEDDEPCYDNGLSKKEDAKNDFFSLDDNFAEHFLEMPYQQRKVLMVVDTYTDLYQKHMQVISLSSAEDTKINFPLGHPRSKQIYIGHPLIPSKYIPLENYQLEFVEDKIREFCLLAQNLGATEITISALNSTSTNSKQSGTRNASVNIDHWAADASGSFNREFSTQLIEELGKTISLHQTFQPHSKPIIPEGLVWYQNEPSWQRLASQRINGNLLSHEERIETRKSQMVESREMAEIKGEFESLLLDVDAKMEKTDERQFFMQENAILSIKVSFAAPSQLNNSNSKMINSTQKPQTPQISSNPNNKNEEEYLENYVDILADYGEIGQRERKRLEKDRVRLGISEARAKELEAGWANSTLSDKEKEYLEEFKEMMEDYGSISDRERKRLDKIRTRLGISESRAAEIERLP